jgi:hypothetical protein
MYGVSASRAASAPGDHSNSAQVKKGAFPTHAPERAHFVFTGKHFPLVKLFRQAMPMGTMG